MNEPRTAIVRTGYDALGARYSEWAARVEGDPRTRLLQELAERLEPGATVLDLGCGPGIPSTVWLAQFFDVVGVDFSEVQLEQARCEIPSAIFVAADICEVDFPDCSFDAVTALYSLTHVPRERHAELFGRIAGWLRPGGWFLVSLSARGSEDWVGDWLGVDMFFSGWNAETNRRLLADVGLRLDVDEVVEMDEPEGTATFQWVIAQTKPAR
jgi:SAM-dependent methyltransferase